jgi:hypothetical protein
MSHFPAGVSRLFNRLAEEFKRETEELQGEMAGARYIFNQIEKIFNRVIQVYQDNPTIIRSLYCQKDFFAELFRGQGIDRLFGRIYPKNGPVEAYFLLGFDFLRSGHVVQSVEAFSNAAKAARQRRMPLPRLRQLYGRHRERALASLHKPGDATLAFQLRLRECEESPVMHPLVGESPTARPTTERVGRQRAAVAAGT